MKKLLLGTTLLVLAIVVPIPARAQVITSSPPPIAFGGPPDVIVMPDTNYVYVVPDIDDDMFFWDGSWWRLWNGRWYRSYSYDGNWAYYENVPVFYYDVDPGWRGYYRDHNWYGHQWNYQRIPQQQLQKNWRTWNRNQYWEKHGTWNVQNYQPRPQQQRQELRRQRQEQYLQRPEVRRHQQRGQLQQTQPRVQQPAQQQRQPRVQQLQQRPRVQTGAQKRTITPQGGPPDRGKRRQVQPAGRRGFQRGPAPAGEKKHVKPAKKVRPVVPKKAPVAKDEKKPVGPGNAPR